MKYIMLKQQMGSITRKIPIIFPEVLVHQDVAKSIIEMIERYGQSCEVISAGNIDMSTHRVWGKSMTLKLESNEEDANTINAHDYLHGIE